MSIGYNLPFRIGSCRLYFGTELVALNVKQALWTVGNKNLPLICFCSRTVGRIYRVLRRWEEEKGQCKSHWRKRLRGKEKWGSRAEKRVAGKAEKTVKTRAPTVLTTTECWSVVDRSLVSYPGRGGQMHTVLAGLYLHSSALEGERRVSKRGNGEPVESSPKATRWRRSLLVTCLSPLCKEMELRCHKYTN